MKAVANLTLLMIQMICTLHLQGSGQEGLGKLWPLTTLEAARARAIVILRK